MDPRRADARRTRSVSAGIGEDQQLRIAELIDLTLLQLDELIDVWCELNALGRQHYLALGLSRNARPVPGREACADALDLPQSQTLMAELIGAVEALLARLRLLRWDA